MCEVSHVKIDNQSESEPTATKKSGPKVFPTFRLLDKHARVEHDRYYCDLCSGHLKVTKLTFGMLTGLYFVKDILTNLVWFLPVRIGQWWLSSGLLIKSC